MKKRPSLILLVILTFVNAGCGGQGSEQPPSPSPSVSPNATATPPVPPPPSPQAKTPAPQKSPADLAALGLIPSTKANQRRQEILAGRTNPFALIPVQATIRQVVCQLPPQAKLDKNNPAIAKGMAQMANPLAQAMANAGKGMNQGPSAAKPPSAGDAGGSSGADKAIAKGTTGKLPTPKGRFDAGTDEMIAKDSSLPTFTPVPETLAPGIKPSNNGKPNLPQTAIKPSNNAKTTTAKNSSLPSVASAPKSLAPGSKATTNRNNAKTGLAPSPAAVPTEALEVEVSGVLSIGQKPFAIIKAPGETAPRYVGVGSRVANGLVRVVAINNSGSNPSVVLEQNGVSVNREVGQALAVNPGKEVSTNPGGGERTIPSLQDTQIVSPKARSFPSLGKALFVQPPQILAQIPTFESVPKGPNFVALIPPSEEGFGEVRSLSLLSLKIQLSGSGTAKSTGIICNTGKTPLQVQELTLQVEDKENNTILDSLRITFPTVYTLKYGQKLEFDGSIPDLRGRKLGNITVSLIDWSGKTGSN